MTPPPTEFYPPFSITRASHTVLTVKDLAASRDFYTRVFGLVVSHESHDALYLRGVEEVCHHSLVLRCDGGEAACERIGLRVMTDAELDKAKRHFDEIGCASEWAQVEGQGRTLRVRDPMGLPLEFCAAMSALPRLAIRYDEHRGGAALRFDHYQFHMADLTPAWAFYASLGFRTSDYVLGDDHRPVAIFLHRKDVPWDFVIMENKGPRLHHLAYVIGSVQDMYKACDLAGQYGYGRQVERGPGTHPGGHGRYVYFRDPDGHRAELLLDAPHHMTDVENEPRRLVPKPGGADWGLPARRAWYDEATTFAATPVTEPAVKPSPLTIESYLSIAHARADAG